MTDPTSPPPCGQLQQVTIIGWGSFYVPCAEDKDHSTDHRVVLQVDGGNDWAVVWPNRKDGTP